VSAGPPASPGPGAPGEPAVVILPDEAAVAAVAADLLAEALAVGAAARGRGDFASTGGSTPGAVYRALLTEPTRQRVPWDVLHVWLGDERYVPRAHPDSNMRAIDRILLAGDPGRGLPPAPLDPARVHPWPTDASLAAGESPARCAERFEAFLRGELKADGAGRPLFDAILVGVGPDGHLLSVFEGSAAQDAPGWTSWAAAPGHIEPHHDRVTLAPAALDATPALVVAVLGAAKATIVAELLGPAGTLPTHRAAAERHLPALRARRAGATWVLDAAAAALLEGAAPPIAQTSAPRRPLHPWPRLRAVPPGACGR
jgi:6-phosphogluconolactonase/glucosamine-6-phosphate isomerase/deaminase